MEKNEKPEQVNPQGIFDPSTPETAEEKKVENSSESEIKKETEKEYSSS